MKAGYERIYAKVDLDIIKENLDSIMKRSEPKSRACAVLKADGYGHGAVEIAHVIEDRVWGFAVATVDEGLEMRRTGIQKPILLLGYANENRYAELIRNEIRVPVFEKDMAQALDRTAAETGKKALVHIKVDTGMSRIGLLPDAEGLETAKEIASCKNLNVEGIFTHLATADMVENAPALLQIQKFLSFTKELKNAGVNISLKHYANSAASMALDTSESDLCRIGISLYGLYPSDELDWSETPIRPALSLYSQVTFVKTLPKGTAIGYGGSYVTEKEQTIATVSCGYADGYSRGLSNKADVLIRGKRCKVAGRICMDQFMVDVTPLTEAGIPVRRGDTVTLIGTDGDETVTMEELGALSGRFNYEFACELSKRVPHVFIENGQEVSCRDYF